MDEQDKNRFSIRHASRATGRQCAVTREWINDGHVNGWVLSCGIAMVSEEGKKHAPAALLELLAELRATPAPDAEGEYAIVALASAPERQHCFADWMKDEPIWRGPDARYGISAGSGAPRLLGVPAAWRLAPTLAALLHKHNHLPAQPAPAVAPPKPKPAPPTRDEIRAAAILKVGLLLSRDGAPGRADINRAEGLLAAIELYTEARK